MSGDLCASGSSTAIDIRSTARLRDSALESIINQTSNRLPPVLIRLITSYLPPKKSNTLYVVPALDLSKPGPDTDCHGQVSREYHVRMEICIRQAVPSIDTRRVSFGHPSYFGTGALLIGEICSAVDSVRRGATDSNLIL